MIINTKELEKLIEEIKENPDNKEELLKGFKLFHAFFEENDGIPPRFGANFRDDGPKWEKVNGLDFEAIGRILICHLSIEHYINNLIDLSTPSDFNWDKSRLTFSQKMNLISNLHILNANNLIKGIEILNSIRNKLSHDMLGTIDEQKLIHLKKILLDTLCHKKSEKKQKDIIQHVELFGPHAIIERFTSIVCAKIAGYCIYLINKESDGESYYKHVRNS